MELDPCCILLNQHGFRGKFHIYDIRWAFDADVDRRVYTVGKQLINPIVACTRQIQEIIPSEKHTEVQVTRDDLVEVYDYLSSLSIPVSRTGHAGVDGTSYSLQIGFGQSCTVIHWWSDMEPELNSLYKLRNKIIKTVNRMVRAHVG